MRSKFLSVTHVLAISALALAFSISAQGQASRTFVSTTGNDSNTAANCSASANCRTLTAALSVTNSGGEVVVVNSGSYDPITITKPVIIAAVDVAASITQAASGASAGAINVLTGGNVTLIGLSLHGQGTGNVGIYNAGQQVSLRLYRLLIENFSEGISTGVGHLVIHDSNINDNGLHGLLSSGGDGNGGEIYIENTGFDNNGQAGIYNGGSQMAIVDSSAHGNGIGFASNGTRNNTTLIGDSFTSNGTGLSVTAGSVRFAYCVIADNGSPYSISGSGTLAGSNPASSLVIGTGTGTLSAPITLQ